MPGSGQELLDLAQNGFLVARPEQVVLAVERDELGAGDALGDLAPLIKERATVAAPMQDKRRDADGG